MSSRVTRWGYLKDRITIGQEPPWLKKHKRRDYVVRVALSTPAWRNRDAIRALERKADLLTKLTGVAHVLDHILPVSHPMVCGLTVHNNLQIITQAANMQKNNSLNAELFDQPEQLRML